MQELPASHGHPRVQHLGGDRLDSRHSQSNVAEQTLQAIGVEAERKSQSQSKTTKGQSECLTVRYGRLRKGRAWKRRVVQKGVGTAWCGAAVGTHQVS
jgi:hypothetical protein